MKINCGTTLLVLKDIIANFWIQYLIIGILSAFSFVLQTIGVSVIISSFNSKLDLPFNLNTIILSLINSGYIVFAGSFICLSLSAVLLFLARKITASSMVEYEGICANALASKLFSQPETTLSAAEILRLLSKDCRFGGRIVQETSNIIMPMGVSLVAVPLMLYLNFMLTLVILAMVLTTLLPYGIIAKKANKISYSFEVSAGLDSQCKKTAVNNYLKNTLPPEPVLFPHPDFKTDYQKRLVIPHYGVLIGNIQISFCLAILAWWFFSKESHVLDFSNVVLYGFIALFALNQLRNVTKVFTSFHVFLAYFQRAFFIIKDIVGETSSASTIADSTTLIIEDDL